VTQPRPPCGKFEDFYISERDHLVSFICKHGARLDDAWDIAHETFVKALRLWEGIRNPRAWIRRVASRAYIEQQTKSATDLQAAFRADWLHRPQIVNFLLRDEWERVHEALASLPLRQRQVMAWHLDGYRPAEIAEELNVDAALVRSNLRHARNKLKEILLTDGDTDTELPPKGGAR
jgi:RNA polymerase sigma factor (sigma-70 family)